MGTTLTNSSELASFATNALIQRTICYGTKGLVVSRVHCTFRGELTIYRPHKIRAHGTYVVALVVESPVSALPVNWVWWVGPQKTGGFPVADTIFCLAPGWHHDVFSHLETRNLVHPHLGGFVALFLPIHSPIYLDAYKRPRLAVYSSASFLAVISVRSPQK